MNIDWTKLSIPGCYAAKLPVLTDKRGSFSKLFHQTAFQQALPDFLIRESYLTNSRRGVLRGMHFQLPPHGHQKVVVCLSGGVLDVMVDLRPGLGYGNIAKIEMSPNDLNCVALPEGVAHGFYTRKDNTSLIYFVGTEYAQAHDAGIHWNSIGMDWPNQKPKLSERDKCHPLLEDFVPPEVWSISASQKKHPK